MEMEQVNGLLDPGVKEGVKEVAKASLAGLWQAIITWNWTRKLLHWTIISAGTVSECAFLIASLWMSVNSSVHGLVLLAMPEQVTRQVSELATAAYVALPECILPLATVVVISHARTWQYQRRWQHPAGIWTILFGLPTLVFLILSLITLGCSVASVDFQMPLPLVVIRALAGYMFAFVSLLYARLGIPQEKDRLKQKDDLIAALHEQHARELADMQVQHEQVLEGTCQQYEAQLAGQRQQYEHSIAEMRQHYASELAVLRQENQHLQARIELQNREIENQKAALQETKTAHRQLLDELNKSDEAALQAYSPECIAWLKSGIKTATVEEVSRFSGHSKRKIENAIARGNLQTAPRNRELILLNSLVSWLKNNPPATGNGSQSLHVVAS